jgi:hypothetical protein
MRTIGLLIAAFLTAISSKAGDLPIIAEDSGSKQVDALVIQLVSARPAPFPSGYWGPEIDFVEMPYMTPQVSNALARLKAMGPTIFPNLVKHLGDDRYSYSFIVAAWLNYKVRDAVIEVFADGHNMHSGYKFRKTPSGSAFYVSFEDYLKAKEPEKWAEWAKSRTRLEIQTDFIDWCVQIENQRGFTDDEQRKRVLGNYENARTRVREEYSERKDALGTGQSNSLGTNQSSKATGSGR